MRDGRFCGLPDHTIWHFFVIGGSMCHFYAIFYYLLPFPYENDPAITSETRDLF